MKISKLIAGLLVLATPFYGVAQSSYCAVEETKLKPVFINGMFNRPRDARKSAEENTKRLQALYGSSVVGETGEGTGGIDGYYLAYNTWEWIPLTQLSEVTYEYFQSLFFIDGYKPSDDDKSFIAEEFDREIANLSEEEDEHVVEMGLFLADGYDLLITGHSQGNLKFNLYYDALLKYHLDNFRYMSVASPISIKAPLKNYHMVIEKSDFIKMLGGISSYHGVGNSNADNTNLEGHKFINYLNGDDTGNMMNTSYKEFLEYFYPNESVFTITADIGSNTSEFLVVEMFQEPNQTIPSSHMEYTYSNSIFNQTPKDKYLPLRGNLTVSNNKVTYSLDCKSISYIGAVMVGAWNKGSSDIGVNAEMSGLYNDSFSQTIIGGYSEDYTELGGLVSFFKDQETGIIELSISTDND